MSYLPDLSPIDVYHLLDETTALEPIDDVFGAGLPLISFQSLGSMLFAEDTGVPERFHCMPVFQILRGGRCISHVVTDEVPRSRASRPPARIDDDLVAHLKRPIALPSRDPASVRSVETHSYSYGYAPAIAPPAQSTAHRRHHSSVISSQSSGLISPHHSDPSSHSNRHVGPSLHEAYRESLRRHSPSGHAKRPSLQYQLPPPLPNLPPSRFH